MTASSELSHADVWRALDLLAEKNGLSPSGLARKAGLSSTVFNPSKRVHEGRERWPSTESISLVLKATDCSLKDFIALGSDKKARQETLPLLPLAEAQSGRSFTPEGLPNTGWDAAVAPETSDAKAFVLEISGRSMEPAFRDGDRLVVSPSAPCRKGDRAVVRTRTGKVMVKILGRETATKVEFLGLFQHDPTLVLERKEISWIYRLSLVQV